MNNKRYILKLFLIMCARIKALLRDFEDSLNMGCLVLVLQQRIQTTGYCWTKMLKIAVTTILARV